MSNRFVDFTIALDKLDKVGVDGVIDEMKRRSFDAAAIDGVKEILNKKDNSETIIAELKALLASSLEGAQGIEELEFVLANVHHLGLKSSKLVFDVTLARGLNYYTGAIFEVVADNVQMGSIGGGGRYDDLTGVFGLQNMSGIGISFGLDRIYLCLEELDLFPKSSLASVQAVILNFGDKESLEAMKILERLRAGGVSAELYPEPAKLKKQFDYAAKKGIQYALFLGEEEIQSNTIKVKNLESGEQKEIGLADLICFFFES